MNIQCAQCKSSNPPSEGKCQECGADLLPGYSQPKRIALMALLVLGMLYFGYLGFMVLSRPYAPRFLLALVALLMGFTAFAFWAVVKGPAESVRYLSRAKRHLKLDLDQAYSDYTQALRLQPLHLAAHQGRGKLYDKLVLTIEDLDEEIQFLTGTLKKTGRLNDSLRGELAGQVVKLSLMRINRERESGLADESVNHILQLLDFMEAHQADIHQFKDPAASFGAGVTLHLRGEMRKNILRTRQELYRAGLVQASGYCRRCKETVEPDLDLNCSIDRTHGKLDKLRFFLPDQAVEEPSMLAASPS